MYLNFRRVLNFRALAIWPRVRKFVQNFIPSIYTRVFGTVLINRTEPNCTTTVSVMAGVQTKLLAVLLRVKTSGHGALFFRRSRALRGGGAHAKRSGAGRPPQLGIPVLREPSPNGHSRVAGVVRPLHRRLPVRSDTRVLLRRLEVRVQTDRLQREQVAHSRRRMESHVLQLQRDYPHRVSDGRAGNGFSPVRFVDVLIMFFFFFLIKPQRVLKRAICDIFHTEYAHRKHHGS